MRLRAAAFAVLFSVIGGTAHAGYRNSVWLPTWGGGVASVQTNADALQESNPVWYALNSDGSIALKNGAESPTALAAMVGTQILPTIQNTVNSSFSASVAAQVIATADARDAHASAIVQLVVAKAYDGIDVDYERLPATQMANFSAFISTLAQKMHAVGKKLSVSVYPKTADTDNWSGPGGEDYRAIGAAADFVKIMAYDYHWDTSAPGAITPLDWLDKVASYATSKIAASKVIMGLPWYGYDWQGSNGVGVTYAQAMQRVQSNNATVTHDVNGEATFTYADHTVYFQDASAYSKKVQMLKQKHASIGGFAHWAAGQEDPQVWAVVRGGSAPSTPPNSGSNPATPPVQTDFSVSGPSVLTVAQGSRISADYRLTAINGFSGNASVNVQVLSSGFDGTVTPSSSIVSATSPVSVTIAANRTAPAGSYQFTVRFTSGSTTREELVNVVVQAVSPGRTRAVRH